jgi:hypothetical protein
MTDEPDRLPDPAAVMANHAELIQKLRLWLLSPNKAGPEEDIITLQSRYVTAMAEFALWLTAAGEKDLALKIMVLEDALRRLRYGTVEALLQPAQGIGRGPDGMVRWGLREDVVIGLECFLISGKFKTKEKAAKYIADKYPKVFDRLKRNRKNSLVSSILNWQRRINDGDVPEAEAVQAHRRSFFEQYGGDNRSPAEMVELGKRQLAEAAERTTKAITPLRARTKI